MIKIIDPVTSIELLCLTIAIFFLGKDKQNFWTITLAYLVFVCCTEYFGKYIGAKYKNNLWVYNVFVFFEAAFISYGLYNCFKRYINPKPLFLFSSIIIYTIYFVVFIRNGVFAFNSITVSVMSVIFVLYCLYYYYLLLRDEHLLDITYHSEFWWLTAVLFYYFGSTTSNLFFGLFKSIKIGPYPLTYAIYILLNWILYGLWAYSFICRAKQRKLQS
ncbi:hypothetical protein QF042_005309 [Pedobacter sp. W3I1]|nr:hypothetical protein [Pedobacter sp. W3I1]